MALLSMDPTTMVLARYWRALERDYQARVLSHVARRTCSAQAGGKILPVHGRCGEGKD
jgi:hypothetical protein